MTLSVWIDDGSSIPSSKTLKQRLWMRWGRWLASRQLGVEIGKSCRVHPEARINPRGGILKIGESTSISAGAIIQGQVDIGSNSSVQAYAILVGYGEPGSITIGNGVRIAPQAMLIAANHVFSDSKTPIYLQGMEPMPIVIEDDVWLGGRVIVTAGVRIGRGCVVGAGSVVTKNLPPWSVAVGAPARIIRYRK